MFQIFIDELIDAFPHHLTTQLNQLQQILNKYLMQVLYSDYIYPPKKRSCLPDDLGKGNINKFNFKKKDGKTSLCSEFPLAVACLVPPFFALSEHLVIPEVHPPFKLRPQQPCFPIQLFLCSKLPAQQLSPLPTAVEDSFFRAPNPQLGSSPFEVAQRFLERQPLLL